MEQTKRKEQIMKVAIETIAALGYSKASVGEISKRAGISKGVFTYHFASKDDLMDQIVREVYEAGFRFMQPKVEGQTSPIGMLTAYIESNLAFIKENCDYIVALAEVVMNARTPEGKLRFAGSTDDSILEPLIEIFKWGEETGEFRTFTERAARVTASAIRSAIDSVATQLVAQPNLDIPGFSEELVSLFLAAVCKPKVSTGATGEKVEGR
ncbi:TetR/AcrR family transcriptional regulator [Paenibacillus sp. FSL W8-0426]|uniref:TetR/AcrR family transcriptional regulator n=1 Tax=Paenibacillus sp. FSL W8-0426 TaxID=2921714 RepID=UPI0030DC3B63